MKKVIFNRYGNLEQLQMVETEIPPIKKGELLIRVKAIGINPLDLKILNGSVPKFMTGWKFPKGIGFDFSGIVEKISEGVVNYKVGDNVFGAMNAMKGHALAEYLVIEEKAIYKKPDNVSFEQAAVLTSTGVAAIQMLEKANVVNGQEILINGATGGIGIFVVQMAMAKGLKITAVASGKGLQFIEKYNLDHIVDYKKQNILELNATFDAVLEMAGTLPFSKTKAIMKPKSVYVGSLPDPRIMILGPFLNLFSSKKLKAIMAYPTQVYMKELADLASSGMEVAVETFPFSSYREAYETTKKGGVVGKIAISI